VLLRLSLYSQQYNAQMYNSMATVHTFTPHHSSFKNTKTQNKSWLQDQLPSLRAWFLISAGWCAGSLGWRIWLNNYSSFLYFLLCGTACRGQRVFGLEKEHHVSQLISQFWYFLWKHSQVLTQPHDMDRLSHTNILQYFTIIIITIFVNFTSRIKVRN